MKFRFIRDHQEQFPIAVMCQVLKVEAASMPGMIILKAIDPDRIGS
jgi:hypothetical protein